MYDPKLDGITHLNCYSKGKTELGRLLSNFAHTPFLYRDKWFFASVESAWYTFMIQKSASTVLNDTEFKSDLLDLSKMHGFEAKKTGKELVNKYDAHKNPSPTVKVITALYKDKLSYNGYIGELLVKNELPLVHYYVIDGNYVDASKYQWQCDIWNVLRGDIINNKDVVETI